MEDKTKRRIDGTCSTQAVAVVAEMYLSHNDDDKQIMIGRRVRFVCTLPEPHDAPHLFEIKEEDYV